MACRSLKRRFRAASFTTKRARRCSSASRACRILSHANRNRAARLMRRGHREQRPAGRRGRGIRLGLQPQDGAAARSPRSPQRLHTHRHFRFRALSRRAAHPAKVSRHRACIPFLAASTIPANWSFRSMAGLRVGFFPGSTIGNLPPAEVDSLPAICQALPRPRRAFPHRRRPAKAARYPPARLRRCRGCDRRLQPQHPCADKPRA